MEPKEIFRILEIEETRDKNAIKATYRRLLAHTNPEDNPEGFKRLRQAYEEAVRYADRPADSEQKAERDTSPIGLWLERAEQIYQVLSRRTSLAEWQELLKDDLCQALDTADEVRERFLAFLMNHFRLPQDVWRLFDKEFLIVEQKRQLLEKFPRDFMNYICFEIENGGFIDFSLFDGADDGPYDKYIGMYLQVKRLTDGCMAGDWDAENREGQDAKSGATSDGSQSDTANPTRQMAAQALDLLAQMDDLDIYHPFAEVERLRLAMKAKRKDEVAERLEVLSVQETGNTYVMLQCGAAQEFLERFGDARTTYETLLSGQPDNYPAGVGMVRCELQAGQWAEAKERVMDLLDVSKNDPQLLDAMRKANSHLIPEMEARLRENPDDWNERIELGWCYFQEECCDDCIRLLNEKPVPEEQRIDYCNMLSRTYLMKKDYEASLPLLREWQQRMFALPDSDDPEQKKKKRRIGYTYYAIAFCSQETGRREEALPNYDEAIAREKDEDMLQSYMMAKAQLLCRMKRYEESADTCDKLLDRNEQYVPAYVCRQECSYRMHRAQAVVDDYHRAVGIYQAYLPPYMMAAKVFYFYRQYKNSMEVIEAARKQGLTSAELDFFEAKNLRYLAEKKEDLDRPKELCRAVIDWVQSADPDREPEQGEDPIEEAEVWKELAFCYMDEKNWSQALSVTEEGLRHFPGEDGLRYAKAGILKGLKNYKEAEDLYRQLLKGQPENTVIMGQLADCMEKSGKNEGLEKLYQKILELDPDDIRASSRLMHIYQDRMNDRRDYSWFQPALDLADKLIRLQPTAYYYIERGLLLSDVYLLEDAIRDYKKAMELEPDNLYAQNNAGVNFQHLDKYETAEKYYRRAIELLSEEDKSVLPWKNLAVLYLIQGRFEEALQCMEENEKLFPGRASFYMDRAEIYERMGRFEDAIREYGRYLNEKDSKSKRAMADIADDYASQGNLREAEKRYKKLLKDYPEDKWIEGRYLEYLLEAAMDYKTAYGILKKRLADPKDDGKETVKWLEKMVQTCFFLKKWKERDQYFARALDVLTFKCGSDGQEGYIGLKATAPSYLYHVGLLYLYGGETEKAEQIFRRMMSSHRCDFCHYGGCYEALLGMALVRIRQKQFDEAEEYLQRCRKINPYSCECQYYLNNRRKW